MMRATLLSRLARAPLFRPASFSTHALPHHQQQRFAVLVDAENTSHSKMKPVMEEIAKYGVASVRRVYGDFTKQQLSPWQKVTLDLSFRSVQAFSYAKGKGSSDTALIIDAMDLMHKNETVDGFCVVSSDSDYTGLVHRLREEGKTVLGFGRLQTPKAFVAACERFIYVENLSTDIATTGAPLSSSGGGPASQCSSAGGNLDGKVVGMLCRVVEELGGDDDPDLVESGWVNLGEVGKLPYKRAPDFDPRTYGCKTLGGVFRALSKTFETKTSGRGSSSFQVRVKPR